MLILGFGYEANQGKDTAAAVIKQRFSQLPIYLMSFAEQLRSETNEAAWIEYMDHHEDFDPQMAMRALCASRGVPYDEHPEINEDYPYGKQRALLQWWGTEYRRAQDDNYWVKKAETNVTSLCSMLKRDPIFIFRDLRFPNEFEWIKSQNGICVKVCREGFEAPQLGHISEHALDGYTFDHTISAPDGRLDLLCTRAVTLFDELVNGLYIPYMRGNHGIL